MIVLRALDYSPHFAGGIGESLRVQGQRMRARGDRLMLAFPRKRTWFDRFDGLAETMVVPQIVRPLRSGFARRVEEIVRGEGIDLVHLTFSFALPLALACRFRRLPVPVVYDWHNPPRPLLPGRSALVRMPAGLLARLADQRSIDVHLAISREIRDLLVAHGWTRSEKILLLPNALAAMPQAAAPGSDTGAVIGSVANFRPQKDHATLLRAFRLLREEIPAARLILVGDGPTREETAALARDLGLAGEVEFTGSLPDPSAAYRRIDVFALSTRYEGQGLVLLEAMAHGLPVVATDLPVIRETLHDGSDALLVPAGDPAAMARALGRLLRDPDLRRALGDAGRRRVRAEFTIEQWCARLLGIYERISTMPLSSRG